MKEMTIRISDLKLLVEQLFKADAYNRARISVFTNLQGPDATAVHEMTYQTEQALPASVWMWSCVIASLRPRSRLAKA